MHNIDPIYIGEDAISQLLHYCQQQALQKLLLVADDNTYTALGRRVEASLHKAGYTLTSVVLTSQEVVADERHVTQVLVEAPVREQTFIAIGSGTLTDITRFVSHRTRCPFISMPTAPSVDGFTSIGAPLLLKGMKHTLDCHAPVALFVDLPTLQAAPQRLIAAGFGDILGKTTSLADWQLNSLLWEGAYDAGIARRSRQALDACLQNADEIGQGGAVGIRALIEGLIESGICMMEFGTSHPASGSEHHSSHYWEMRLLQEGRPALLHGAKVGAAAAIIAGLYQKIREMPFEEAQKRILAAQKPTYDAELESIRRGYGATADEVIAAHGRFLKLTDADFEALRGHVLSQWGHIVEIADGVLSSAAIKDYLNRVHGPATPEALGLSAAQINDAYQYGHYLRDRFTVRKLFHLFSLADAPGKSQ